MCVDTESRKVLSGTLRPWPELITFFNFSSWVVTHNQIGIGKYATNQKAAIYGR